jgi:predicted ArsR family transcriptional regulator
MHDEIVLTAQQLVCLATPASTQAMSCLTSLGRASASQLAKGLNRSPATAIYHLRKLERVGLAKVVATRATGRRPEVVYAPAAERLTLPDEASEIDHLVTRSVLAGLREAMRGFAAAPGRRQKHVVRCQMRLTNEDAAHFFAMLEAATQFASARRLERGGVLLAWNSVVFPEQGPA